MTKQYIANRPFGGFTTHQTVTGLPDFRMKELLEMGIISETTAENKAKAETAEQPTQTEETSSDEPTVDKPVESEPKPRNKATH